MAEPSPLRAMFDRAERLIGRPLENAINTETFMEAVAGTIRLLAAMDKVSAAASAAILHRFNLPAHSDLLDLKDEIRRLEARVRESTESGGRPPSKRRSRVPGPRG